MLLTNCVGVGAHPTALLQQPLSTDSIHGMVVMLTGWHDAVFARTPNEYKRMLIIHQSHCSPRRQSNRQSQRVISRAAGLQSSAADKSIFACPRDCCTLLILNAFQGKYYSPHLLLLLFTCRAEYSVLWFEQRIHIFIFSMAKN